MKIECPNHNGSFDCTPFCELCSGEQEIESEPTDCSCDAFYMFKCKDCLTCTNCSGEYYMVTDSVWTQANGNRGMLCVGCLEARRGKLLTARDFTDCILNDMNRQNGSSRLRARLAS